MRKQPLHSFNKEKLLNPHMQNFFKDFHVIMYLVCRPEERMSPDLIRKVTQEAYPVNNVVHDLQLQG